MYQPVTPWGDQVRRTTGASKTRTLVPGGTRDVQLKLKAPLRWALADRQVAASGDSNQVVLVGGNGAFHNIGAVQVRRNELKSDAGVYHDLFEAGWAVVVEHLKARRETTVGEVSMEVGIRADKFVLAARFEWLYNDGITVVVVEDHEVFSAATGCDGETTCLVRGYLAGNFDGIQECHFGSDVGFQGWNRRRRYL